ncbi:MAG: hypothetical protein QNJ98_13075 [Planctomycetota bacterium]|nr:hypothetical protein [Planctomycetota bacterium]
MHRRVPLLLLALALAPGCSNSWQDATPAQSAVEAGEIKAILERATVWKGVLPAPANDEDLVEGRWHLVQEPVQDTTPAGPVTASLPEIAKPLPAPVPPPVIEQPPPRPKPTLPVPRRRVTPPKPKRGTPINKSPQELVRAHYLDNPTTVRAGKITFYCPAAYLGEVRLKADDIVNTSADRRVATGGARLLCRELTLIAERITLRIRRDGDAELQVTARGNVELVSRVRNKATRETGLRSLILRQDQMMPLR